MTQISLILTPQAGLFERAIAESFDMDLPVPIVETMDPGQTPSRFLPFLAAHRSVDLWFEDWPEERKRRMVAEAITLAPLKGTRAAAEAFLTFVDTEILHKVSYPSRSPVGRIAAGISPINHPTFTARFLLRTELRRPSRAICVGRSAVGRDAVRTVDFEPLRRAKHALVVSKAPETVYSVTFAHRIRKTLDDNLDLNSGYRLGSFRQRIRL